MVPDYLLFKLLQTLRRLAQNREAARKSRLRKKVGMIFSIHTHMLSSSSSLSIGSYPCVHIIVSDLLYMPAWQCTGSWSSLPGPGHVFYYLKLEIRERIETHQVFPCVKWPVDNLSTEGIDCELILHGSS